MRAPGRAGWAGGRGGQAVRAGRGGAGRRPRLSRGRDAVQGCREGGTPSKAVRGREAVQSCSEGARPSKAVPGAGRRPRLSEGGAPSEAGWPPGEGAPPPTSPAPGNARSVLRLQPCYARLLGCVTVSWTIHPRTYGIPRLAPRVTLAVRPAARDATCIFLSPHVPARAGRP